MKLKFKADASDVVIFILFAIFLLYVVCLAVLNFPELAINGRFFGLNPLPAFAPDRIVGTLVFYLLALAGIFMSVSSYFFEREKGFGFGTEKSSKGYSHWAKEKEIKEDKGVAKVNPRAESSDVAGVPLIIKKDEVWVDNGEYHNLVIGATGSGKTQTVIFPTVEVLAKKRESMIITDPKGEIYEQTSNMLREKGYNVLILNFRDPQDGNSWNPLSLPYRIYRSGNQDKAIELLDDLAANILYEEKSGNADPFWEKTSADYFSGLALGLFEDTTEENVNLNSISLMTTVGEEKIGGSTFIKEYFNTKDPASPAYTNASGTIMAPNETKGSIISVFKQKIKLFASRENLSEMLSHSDFELESIGEKPTVLFIVIQDEKKTYHSLVTILLKQCYETLISVAQKNGGKLPVRTNFLLDEFANMPPLKDITTMITAARSRQIRFTMIIQNFAQLDQVYGKENAETIKGNCGNIIYLITTELKALEEISKMCGEVKSKKDDKTASTPLVTISDLQRMKQFEVIIMRMRKNPFKTKFVPYYQMEFGKKYPKATYPHREKQEVHVFDLRKFVLDKRNQKMMEAMNSAGASGGLPGGIPGGMSSGMGGFPSGGMLPGGFPGGMFSSNGATSGLGGMNSAPQNPFAPKPNTAQTQSRALNSGFNVDDLVKKIDAKIAEIEAEEKRQKEQLAAQNKPAEAKTTETPKEEAKIEPPKAQETPLPSPTEPLSTSGIPTASPTTATPISPPTDIKITPPVEEKKQPDFDLPSEKKEISSPQQPVQSQQSTNTMTIEDLLNPKRPVSEPVKNNIQDVDDFIRQFQDVPKPHLGNQPTPEAVVTPVMNNQTVPEPPRVEATPNVVPKENPIIHEDKIPEKEIDVTDDQFFDDFFDD
jgi:type IV secretory pathway, VirD4 component